MSSDDSDAGPRKKVRRLDESPASTSSGSPIIGSTSRLRTVRRQNQMNPIDSSGSETDSDGPIITRNRRRTARVSSNSDSESSGLATIRPSRQLRKLPSGNDSDFSDPGFEGSSQWETDFSDKEVETKVINSCTSLPDAALESDSSDGQSEKCPICLLSFKKQEIGTPESCDHTFCLECLQEWSKNMNTCPVDRQEYNLILVRKTLNGKVINQIPIEKPVPQQELDIVEDPTFCEICGSSDNEDRLLLCDGCDLGFHLYCLNPPLESVPIGSWYCSDCSSDQFSYHDDPDIEFDEYQLLLDEADQIGRPQGRRRNLSARLIPRTRQSERVRRQIANNRHQNSRTNRGQSSSPENMDSLEPVSSSTSRRKRRPKAQKRKSVKTRVRYKTVYEIDKVTGETVAVQKRQMKKRKKYSVRRRREVALRPTTVKNRLAKQLGMCTPRSVPQNLPDVKISNAPESINGMRYQAGIPTLNIFGTGNNLDYFSEEEEVNYGMGQLLMSRRAPNRSDAAALRRMARRKAGVILPSIVSSSTDILGNIMNSQEQFHSRNASYSIDSNGNFKIEPKSSKINISKEKGTVKETPYNPKRNNYYNNRYNYNNNSNYNSNNRRYNQYQSYNFASSSSMNNSNNSFQNRGGGGYDDNDYPQDYTHRTLCATSDPHDRDQDEENQEMNESEIDIYSDIETVTTSRTEPERELRPPPTPPEFPSEFNLDDDNDSEPDTMVIDDRVPDQGQDDHMEDYAVSSTVGFPTSFPFPPPNMMSMPPPPFPTALNQLIEEPHSSMEIQSEAVQSSVFPQRRLIPYDDDDDSNDGCPNTNIYSRESQNVNNDDEDSGDECPNFSIYSKESKNVALHTDISLPPPPPFPLDFQDEEISSTPDITGHNEYLSNAEHNDYLNDSQQKEVPIDDGDDNMYNPEEETELLDEHLDEAEQPCDDSCETPQDSPDEEEEPEHLIIKEREEKQTLLHPQELYSPEYETSLDSQGPRDYPIVQKMDEDISHTAEDVPTSPEAKVLPITPEPEDFPMSQETERISASQEYNSPHRDEDVPISHKTDECAPAQESDEFAPAQETDEYAPAQETDEYAPAEETDECPASQKTEEYSASQKTDEYVASQETDEYPAAQETDEHPASQETDELPASQETDELPASQETDEYPMSEATDKFSQETDKILGSQETGEFLGSEETAEFSEALEQEKSGSQGEHEISIDTQKEQEEIEDAKKGSHKLDGFNSSEDREEMIENFEGEEQLHPIVSRDSDICDEEEVFKGLANPSPPPPEGEGTREYAVRPIDQLDPLVNPPAPHEEEIIPKGSANPPPPVHAFSGMANPPAPRLLKGKSGTLLKSKLFKKKVSGKGGLYSDSEDETIIKKVKKSKSFGLNDMMEDISEEERSYTPCLDERGSRQGLEGLETEMISDDDRNDFDESHEMKTGSDGDALEINAKESELDFTRPEDYEEGEIVDKNKDKEVETVIAEPEPEKEKQKKPKKDDDKGKKKGKKKDKDKSNETSKGANKENEGSNKEPSFKKLSKNNKERNYRDKDNEDKAKERNKEKERKKQKRREIERYNVRQIISEKPRSLIMRDQFGRDIRRTPSKSRSRSYTPPIQGSASRGKSPPPRLHRSLSRGRRSISRHRSLSNRLPGASKERRKRRPRRSLTRSPATKRTKSSKKRKRSPTRFKQRKSGEGERRKKKRTERTRRMSRSVSPRRMGIREWERSEWSIDSMSPSNLQLAVSPSWTPPRLIDNTQALRNEHLTVTLNNSNKKKKDKRRSDRRNKETSERRRRRRQMERERTPPPSKEVFASGDNILVSVSFNNENEIRDVRTRDRRVSEEARKKRERRRRNRRDLSGIKPVAIIDLARSPFRELTPSPKAVIVLTDSENERENERNVQQNICDSSQQVASPERSINYSTGPKTPPEPQVKFTLTSKAPQVRAITNPLHEPDEMEANDTRDEEMVDSRINESLHKGPNTPPEPPNSPPSSPDVYDPFEPTKSRSPTPEPSQTAQLSMNLNENSEGRIDSLSAADLEKAVNPTPDIIKSLTPPLLDVQPADSQSSIQATPDTNLIKSPERIGAILNQTTPASLSASKPVAQTTPFSSVPTSMITSTPLSTNLAPSRINILNSTVISPPASSIPQRIVLPNQVKSSPVKISPTKAAIKSTPIKPMLTKSYKMITKKKAPAPKSSSLDDIVLDFDSPYSPGSSDYEDLFEPPSEIVTKPLIKKTTRSPQKHISAFDALFGSPSYKPSVKPKDKNKFGRKNMTSGKTKTVGVKLDEDNLKILDELPNSAVEMLVKDKFLKKLNRQERVVEEVKLVLKPHYNKKRINKEEYKDIMRRAVPKICHNKSGEINPTKIKNLIEAYVRKVRHNKKVSSSSNINSQKV